MLREPREWAYDKLAIGLWLAYRSYLRFHMGLDNIRTYRNRTHGLVARN